MSVRLNLQWTTQVKNYEIESDNNQIRIRLLTKHPNALARSIIKQITPPEKDVLNCTIVHKYSETTKISDSLHLEFSSPNAKRRFFSHFGPENRYFQTSRIKSEPLTPLHLDICISEPERLNGLVDKIRELYRIQISHHWDQTARDLLNCSAVHKYVDTTKLYDCVHLEFSSLSAKQRFFSRFVHKKKYFRQDQIKSEPWTPLHVEIRFFKPENLQMFIDAIGKLYRIKISHYWEKKTSFKRRDQCMDEKHN